MTRLKELRIKSGLLQKDVAERLHVERTTYLRYENGTSEPRNELLCEMADLFDVSVDYLLGKTNEKKPATADGDGLSESDMELVDMVMRIPPEKREALRTVLQALSEDGEVFPSGDH